MVEHSTNLVTLLQSTLTKNPESIFLGQLTLLRRRI
jgi:hypothetical protein